MKSLISKNVQSLQDGVSTQDLAVKMLMFLLQDLLDYSQIKAGKFRKNITRFNLHKAV